MRIAIIGGGIGGLTLALALRQRGLAATVYEQAAELAEIGAAVALSANATRELARLGLLEQTEAASREPTELIWRDGRTAARIASHPVAQGHQYRTRFGAPYLGIHRAALQRILGGALGPAPLHLSHRLETLTEQPGHPVHLRFTNGTEVEADLVVGADGVRSAVRRHVDGGAGLRYSGTSAFRAIIPQSSLPTLPDPLAIQFWCGPDAHLLHYAIGPAADINLFAVVEGPNPWPTPGTSTMETAPGEALAAFKGWHPAAREMVAAIPHPLRWALNVSPRLPSWHRGAVVLLGDAVHAMVPHHGQGANTTIEDAVTLAELLNQSAPLSIPLAATLDRFQSLRRARTGTIQASSMATNHLLHLHDNDPRTPARDHAFETFPDRFAWIHAHDVQTAAQAA